jgi:hypothetical protein
VAWISPATKLLLLCLQIFFNWCPSKEKVNVSFSLEDTEALCCIKIGISPSTLKSSIFVENGHVATSVDFSRLLTQDEQIHDPMDLPCNMSHSPDVL